MQIFSINSNNFKPKSVYTKNAQKPGRVLNKYSYANKETGFTPSINFSGGVNFNGIRGYFPNISPVSFQGTAESLKKLDIYSADGKRKSVEKAEDGSYLVDFETETRIYYGKDAKNFLNSTTVFEDDTQIISPHGAGLKIETDGREISVDSDGVVHLRNGKNAKITVLGGNPLVITSKKAPDWYERYTNNPKDESIGAKQRELSNIYAHFYGGHIRVVDLGDEIKDKLITSGQAKDSGDGFIEMKKYYLPDFTEHLLGDVLSEDEMKVFKHYYERAWKLKISTKEARRVSAKGLDSKLREKLKENKVIFDLNETEKDRVFWGRTYGSKAELEKALKDLGFSKKEIENTVNFWKQTNKLGFDYSGLKYLGDDVAVYSLKDRINNRTGGPQYWYSFSVVVPSAEDGCSSPYIGVSEMHTDKEYKEAVPFRQIWGAEVLHSHFISPRKYQRELYLVTEGEGALTVIEDGEPKTIVLKTGEGIVLEPGVVHCVSAAKGNYKQLVCQVPAINHYSNPIKIEYDFPEGYDADTTSQMAVRELESI